MILHIITNVILVEITSLKHSKLTTVSVISIRLYIKGG